MYWPHVLALQIAERSLTVDAAALYRPASWKHPSVTSSPASSEQLRGCIPSPPGDKAAQYLFRLRYGEPHSAQLEAALAASVLLRVELQA